MRQNATLLADSVMGALLSDAHSQRNRDIICHILHIILYDMAYMAYMPYNIICHII
jgi:hypothetical protein